MVVISGTIAATCLVACGDDSQGTSDTLVVTAQPTNPDSPDPAPFVAQQVEPIVAPTLYEPIHDPGLNVDWTLRGVSSAPIGGIVVHVDVKNLNESALPTDVVKATLKTTGYNGQSTSRVWICPWVVVRQPTWTSLLTPRSATLMLLSCRWATLFSRVR